METIRTKLARGLLPREDFQHEHVVPGGLVGPCAGCDAPTTPRDPVFIGEHAGGRLVLHPDCYVAWDEERGRPSG